MSCYHSLSFTCSILAHLRKALHESSKILVEHALYVARIQPNSRTLGMAGSVMTIGLSIIGSSYSKKQFD